MKIYTEIQPLRVSKTQKETLDKLSKRDIKVSQFIRDAISEKIQREYKDLIVKPKEIICPF